jgi:hypothetical protein
MRPIPPSLNCQHQANTAYDKLAVISENMDKLREIEQFIFELKQWLRAYIDKVRASISAENYANLTENNVFTGINTFADVYLNNGNIYWKDEYNNDIAWIKYDKEHQILTLHVQDSELSLSPNLAITVPTDADVDNSIVTYAFLHGLLQELEGRVTITKDTTITEGSNNVPTTDAVYQFVIGNQFHLTLEDTVLENSSNGVKSSGIYAALQELQSQIDALTEDLSESKGDLFDTFGVEDGLYAAIPFTGRTFLAGHLYKVISSVYREPTTSGPRSYDTPIHLSSDNVEAVKILVYPSISVLTVFRPLEDITVQVNIGPTGSFEANEYVLVDVNAVEELTTKQLIGWDYEL